MEYITLTNADPEFKPYLLGTFSRTHRALPVETFHAQTARERVTFRVLSIDGMTRPEWWMVYFRACRPELLGLTMGPAMAAWLTQHDRLREWSIGPSWLALVGVFFLHTGVFLLNDVQDHLRGFDRHNRRRGSQVIQKGWVSAAEMQRWAWVNLGLALLLGLPAFANAPSALTAVCMGALVCLALLLTGRGTRWGVSDLSLALVFGPLLTVGIALSSFGSFNWHDVMVGAAFGSLTLWVFQARQFEYMFRSQPEGFRTFLGAWDFDRARAICVTEGVLLLVLQPMLALWIGVPLKFFALLPIVSIPMILFIGRLKRAASPLSSNLLLSDRWALASHLSWTLWWITALGVAWL